jgi:thiamine biosynthesis lipoprotein
MGTIATIQVVDSRSCEEPVERAFEWFRQIEARCSRFDPQSELIQLTAQAGVEVPLSAILFEAVQFALAVAEETGGAFDPAVGRQMEAAGFNREYQTGRVVETTVDKDAASYRDIRLNPEKKTITLLRPMILDLGAVAKGLAVDMAARELQPFDNFAIDAGGDLYLAGRNPEGGPWFVGIRHPRIDGELIDSIPVSNRAVCTSGDYERGNHIFDPRQEKAATAVASVTVVAPTAMLADAVATAAFVLGPVEGIRLFERLGVEGLIVSSALERFETQGVFHG